MNCFSVSYFIVFVSDKSIIKLKFTINFFKKADQLTRSNEYIFFNEQTKKNQIIFCYKVILILFCFVLFIFIFFSNFLKLVTLVQLYVSKKFNLALFISEKKKKKHHHFHHQSLYLGTNEIHNQTNGIEIKKHIMTISSDF